MTASGNADTRVPSACGSTTRGRLAHRVTDLRTWTRVDGRDEIDSDETYWTGALLACEVERRHTDSYSLTTGKLADTDDVTTSLGLVR